MTTFKIGNTYLTRDGAAVRIVDDDGEMLTGVLTGENGLSRAERWYLDGRYNHGKHFGIFSFMDLMEPGPVMHTVWLNIYRPDSGSTDKSFIVVSYRCEDSAIKFHSRNKSYVGTFPFTFGVLGDE